MQELERLKKEVRRRIEKNDIAHDFEHIMRVYKNAVKIGRKEKANMKTLLTAVLLHDIVSFPKSESLTKSSSTKSALEAKKILEKFYFPQKDIKIILDAIRDHSYSKNKIPKTLEGKILQDADRLDAIGAIGIARAFATGGAEKRPLYNETEPFGLFRKLDDKKWTLDHFYKKLLVLERRMNTNTAKVEARRRTKIIKNFLHELRREI
ncbi:MAG: HD domain-containing protein [Nitrosopumilaceae archaeon]